MKTVDRYIGVSVGQGYLLVMLVLASVFSFLEFVEQLEDVGDGDYDTLDAFLFVVMTLPRRMLDMVPVTALLGGIIALGALAKGGELVAMQAAGCSVKRLGWSVMKAGLALMVAVAVLEEFVVPPIQQYAESRRTLALAETRDLRTEHGFWSRDGLRFINVRKMLHGRIPSDIDLYEFNQEGRLERFTHAAQANTDDPGRWVLFDVVEKTIGDQHIESRSRPEMHWKPFLARKQLQLFEVPVRSLSPSALHGYIGYLRNSGQRADRYELALWQKLVVPVTTGGMVLLSIPFFFGSMREVSAGQRILMGGIIGLAFSVLNQVIANAGLLLNISAPIVALSPALGILALALLLLRRTQRMRTVTYKRRLGRGDRYGIP